MKFLMIVESDPKAAPPSPETMMKLGAYTQRMIASGKLVFTGGLVRPNSGIRITAEGGKVTLTDGPFTESKELIDGFAVVDVASKEECIALSKEFMGIIGDGKGEILAMFDPPGGPPPAK